VTPLWEIIYPENRIVLDYGQSRFLALLEGIDIKTGKTHDPAYEDQSVFANWRGYSVGATVYTSLQEVVSAIPRQNAEGFVVRYLDTDERVKIKQQDYIDKHKLVFNLSEKTVWESLKDGRFDEYKKGMPDEFHEWMDITASPFLQKFQDHITLVEETRFIPEVDELFEKGDRSARKELAVMTRDAPRWVQKVLWCMWDGFDYTEYIYKQFEPKGQTKVAKP